MEKSFTDKNKFKKKRRVIIALICVLSALVAISGGLAIYIGVAVKNPMSLFESVKIVRETYRTAVDERFVSPEALESDVPDEADDTEKIINILLLGLDVTEDGKTTSGTEYHADVMMVVAINAEENRVDLISLPRDSMTHVPGINGIYKLNAAINVGGGKDAKGGAGFLKACDAARWMLGGLDVDYYYGVGFEAVVELVDAIGGVDFDVDIQTSSSSVSPGLKKGMQHMDGEAVLEYLRARRNVVSGESNDRGRVNRQKKMLVAIFKKLKEQDLFSSIPALLSMTKGIYTNTTVQQTLSLAALASRVNSEDIGMHSLFGPYLNSISWNWTFVDQDNRVSIIKDIYGVDVPKYTNVTYEYSEWMGKYGFKGWKYLSTANKVGQSAIEKLPADDAALLSFKEAYTALALAYNAAAESCDKDDTQLMLEAMELLKQRTLELAEACAYENKLVWNVSKSWWEDSDINEVRVDFR